MRHPSDHRMVLLHSAPKAPILTTSWKAKRLLWNSVLEIVSVLRKGGTEQSQTTTHAQKGLHYICMRGQVGLAMTMNNKTVVSAAVSISSVLHRLAG